MRVLERNLSHGQRRRSERVDVPAVPGEVRVTSDGDLLHQQVHREVGIDAEVNVIGERLDRRRRNQIEVDHRIHAQRRAHPESREVEHAVERCAARKPGRPADDQRVGRCGRARVHGQRSVLPGLVESRLGREL